MFPQCGNDALLTQQQDAAFNQQEAINLFANCIHTSQKQKGCLNRKQKIAVVAGGIKETPPLWLPCVPSPQSDMQVTCKEAACPSSLICLPPPDPTVKVAATSVKLAIPPPMMSARPLPSVLAVAHYGHRGRWKMLSFLGRIFAKVPGRLCYDEGLQQRTSLHDASHDAVYPCDWLTLKRQATASWYAFYPNQSFKFNRSTLPESLTVRKGSLPSQEG